MGLENILVVLPDLLRNLPQIVQTIQIIVYIGLILCFGSIVVIGYRSYLPWWLSFLGRLGFGFLCLLCGSAISPFIPLFKEGIFSFFWLDLIFTMLVFSIIFAIGLFLISLTVPQRSQILQTIKMLQEKLSKMKQRGPSESRFRDPRLFFGVLIIATVVGFSLINFRGFPDLGSKMLMGIGNVTPDDINNMIAEICEGQGGDLGDLGDLNIIGDISSLSPECANIVSKVSQNYNRIMQNLQNYPSYQNEALKQLIEQRSGKTVLLMRRTEIEGQTIIGALMMDGTACLASTTEFCVCAQLQG